MSNNVKVNSIIRVGDNMRAIREDKNISQKDMAKKLGIPSSTYSNYENNNREPKATLLKQIAQVLNVGINELLSIDIPKRQIKTPTEDITMEVIEELIKLCGYNISFNQFNKGKSNIEESLILAIENNTIPLVYIKNENGSIGLTSKEFKNLCNRIITYVKQECNKHLNPYE